FPGGVVGGGDGLSTGKTAEDVNQDVEATEFGDDFCDAVVNLPLIGEIDGHGAKIRTGKLARIHVPRCPDHHVALLQEGLGDECAKAALCPGDENDSLTHVRCAPGYRCLSECE